jgi:hypothetical protein
MTSDVSTLAFKPRDFATTGRRAIVAGVTLLVIVVGVFLHRQRAIEAQLATPAYEDTETTILQIAT